MYGGGGYGGAMYGSGGAPVYGSSYGGAYYGTTLNGGMYMAPNTGTVLPAGYVPQAMPTVGGTTGTTVIPTGATGGVIVR
jgi:hypothetical protein